MGPEPTMGLCGEPNCEEYWVECAVCGCEFCSKCFPNSRFCPDCSVLSEDEDEDEEDSDFEDVDNLDQLLNEENDQEEEEKE